MLGCRPRTSKDDEWDDETVQRRFGQGGLELRTAVGSEDSRFLFSRYGHMLAASGTSWQVTEVQTLARSRIWPWLASDAAAAPIVEQIRRELSSGSVGGGGRSATFVKLCADLAAARERSDRRHRRRVDSLVLLIGDPSQLSVRKAYEAELDTLRQAGERHLRKSRWRAAVAKALYAHAADTQSTTRGSSAQRRRWDASLARLLASFDEMSRAFAEWAHAERRRLTTVHKHATPQPLRHYIFVVNLERYADPMGLDWAAAHAKYDGDWRSIIRGASRPNGNVDLLLVNFRSWLLLQSAGYVREARRVTLAWNASVAATEPTRGTRLCPHACTQRAAGTAKEAQPLILRTDPKSYKPVRV